MTEYEQASGAKVNYKKTKGLWVGNWKGRRVSPMDIEWTSANVKALGVHFGNGNPALSYLYEDNPQSYSTTQLLETNQAFANWESKNC